MNSQSVKDKAQLNAMIATKHIMEMQIAMEGKLFPMGIQNLIETELRTAYLAGAIVGGQRVGDMVQEKLGKIYEKV